jgi:hypothetical protein
VTGQPVLGDFLTAARRDLERARRSVATAAPGRDADEIIASFYRLTVALARHAADLSTDFDRLLGEELDRTRRGLMLGRSWALTKVYNHVHDPDDHDPAIVRLRDIHTAIDEAVMRAYGWDDLELKIGHHQTKIGIRWTVGKEARFELLDRLLQENLRRYKLENP